jgi:epsilon-lactone hydrolase
MPSARGRMVKFILQHRHLFQLKLRQELVDWNKYESILKFRQEVEDGAGKFGKMPRDIKVTPVEIDQLYGEWISPEQAPLDRVMLYFHGGGYVTGTCYSHRAITAKFVKAAGIPALLFEYRLAPENPYPAAL